MKYSDQELNELKREIPLWRIVANRIPKFEKRNSEWIFQCPFHKDGQERTPSFTVFKNEAGLWLFKCFGCGETGGNAFQFVQRYDKIGFDDAVQKVKTESEWDEAKETVSSTFHSITDSDAKALTFPISRLAEAERALAGNSVALRWLAARGITAETAKQFHLGYVQSAAAVSKNHPYVDQGWILIPTLNAEGDTITLLKYRTLVPDAPNDLRWLRKKGMDTTMFNLQTVTPFDDVFVTEGPFDPIIFAQAGYTAASLDCATHNPSQNDRDCLVRANTIYLAGDADVPGQQAMDKLWSEFRDRTFKISWPSGAKDANDFFLRICGGNIEKFREEIEKLKQQAHEQPMPFIYNLSDTMKRIDMVNPFDDPSRYRFPWKNIDAWTPIIPGDVVVICGSDTKVGKSTWVMNSLLCNAIEHSRTVVNYTAEVQPGQYARRAVAYLAHADRDHIGEDDIRRAVKKLGPAKFYNGYKPGANYKDVIELLKWTKRRLGADIVVVDPLSFLIRGARQFEQEGEAMRMFKDFAVEYHVIVVLVTQPRKGLPGQKNREMIGQDISGNYVQSTDASQVFLLHRDRKTGTIGNEPIFSNETKVKLEYSRESETKTTKLFFEGKTATFWEIVAEPNPETEQEPPIQEEPCEPSAQTAMQM